MINLEKEIILFGKPLFKKDIKRFLSSLSDKVYYDMSHVGNLVKGLDQSVQNECEGSFELEGGRMSYRVQVHADYVHHIQIAYSKEIAKEKVHIIKEKITKFFSNYSVTMS